VDLIQYKMYLYYDKIEKYVFDLPYQVIDWVFAVSIHNDDDELVLLWIIPNFNFKLNFCSF